MRAYKLPNGNLLVPMRAEGPGRLISDGMVEVKPGTPEYDEWLPWAEDPPKKRRPRRTAPSHAVLAYLVSPGRPTPGDGGRTPRFDTLPRLT